MKVDPSHTGEAAAKPSTASQPSHPDASFATALAHASSRRHHRHHKVAPEDLKTPPKGETTAPVPGHAYADILSGPRNGMYLNTSGNVRDGMAFVLVKRHGREFHIYGTGKDRQVIEVKHHATTQPATTTPSTPGTTGSTP